MSTALHLFLISIHFLTVGGVKPTREIPYDQYFIRYGIKYSIAPELPMAVAWVESNYWSSAKSTAKALGVMQVLFGTGHHMLPDLVKKPSDLKNPEINIEAGTLYLKRMSKKFTDTNGKVNWSLVLASYAAGPRNIRVRLNRNDKLGRILQSYISRVKKEMYFSYGFRFEDL